MRLGSTCYQRPCSSTVRSINQPQSDLVLISALPFSEPFAPLRHKSAHGPMKSPLYPEVVTNWGQQLPIEAIKVASDHNARYCFGCEVPLQPGMPARRRKWRGDMRRIPLARRGQLKAYIEPLAPLGYNPEMILARSGISSWLHGPSGDWVPVQFLSATMDAAARAVGDHRYGCWVAEKHKLLTTLLHHGFYPV